VQWHINLPAHSPSRRLFINKYHDFIYTPLLFSADAWRCCWHLNWFRAELSSPLLIFDVFGRRSTTPELLKRPG